MPRCEDCGKFVSMENEVEWVGTPEVNADNMLVGEVRVVRKCAEDGYNELKEGLFELDVDLKDEADFVDCVEGDEGHDWDVNEPDLDPTETGGSRYKKNMVGYEGDVYMKCRNCNLELTVHISDEMQASFYDDLT